MTRSLSWLVQRAGVVCGSFEEGATLLGGDWKAVEAATAEEKAAMRFFKVVVEVQ
jgi:hypothetical protein